MARTLDVNYFTKSANFCNWHKKLYQTSLYEEAERYSSLTENLDENIYFFSSPGRTELVGNHTDHNNGFVLASTIDLDTVAAVTKNDKREISVNSAGYPAFTVNIDNLDINDEDFGTSRALVKGILKGFNDRGLKIGGFIANTTSNIFKGAGVSSSAAFELLICEILNVLFNKGKIDCVTKAIISQYAENIYFGKPSGLMDQLTISRGGVSFMDFKNPNMPRAESVNWNFSDVALVIINCGGDHCNLTNEYAEIKDDMKKIAIAHGKKSLRDIDTKSFYESIAGLKNSCGGRAILRAKHYIEENERVIKSFKAINNNDKGAFFECINSSGESSYKQLQNCYAKKDKQQNIPLCLQLAQGFHRIKAKRVHGGGFAGTILVMINKDDAKDFISYMQRFIDKESIFVLNIRNTGTTMVEV